MAVHEGVAFGLLGPSGAEQALKNNPKLRAKFNDVKAAGVDLLLAKGRLDDAISAFNAELADDEGDDAA
ncbi:MAG TPA: hypothetical protein VNF04_06675 [Stellaceae bacterium]|nr:hypothetical protein [Stellaceae bacterium]